MRPADLRGLLALLDERGTVAWVLLHADEGADEDAAPGVTGAPGAAGAAGAASERTSELVVDVSGLESVVSALVARGFRADVSRLPDRVSCRHRRLGRLVIRPCRFDDEGNARGYGDDGPLVLPAAAFDPVDASLRTVTRPTKDPS